MKFRRKIVRPFFYEWSKPKKWIKKHSYVPVQGLRALQTVCLYPGGHLTLGLAPLECRFLYFGSSGWFALQGLGTFRDSAHTAFAWGIDKRLNWKFLVVINETFSTTVSSSMSRIVRPFDFQSCSNGMILSFGRGYCMKGFTIGSSKHFDHIWSRMLLL